MSVRRRLAHVAVVVTFAAGALAVPLVAAAGIQGTGQQHVACSTCPRPPQPNW